MLERKPRVRLRGQIHGGGHERGMRSGTSPNTSDSRHGRSIQVRKT